MTNLSANQLICGDCIDVMQTFPANSIDMVMFSPPYWGLRDYGVEGQIGLESTFSQYVAKMVAVCRRVKRVLKKTGSMYTVLGDTYAGSGCGAQHGWADKKREKVKGIMNEPSPQTRTNLPAKCLIGVPWRVALALIENGWILRNDIIWHKPNHMPSSVKDRLTNSYEHVFHFVQSKRYYYDLDAIRKPHKSGVTRWGGNIMKPAKAPKEQQGLSGALASETRLWRNPQGKNPGDTITVRGFKTKQGAIYDKWQEQHHGKDVIYYPKGKNPGDFLSLATKPFPEAHFAVYPEKLCKLPIKSSCPEKGIVLDPMCGSGTTCVVAHKLGRRWIGIDLKPEYIEIARRRLEKAGAFSTRLTEFA